MQIVNGLEQLSTSGGPAVLTVGVFDGLHLGHREIMRRVARLADDSDLRAVVMTFEHHPLRLLHPARAPGLLLPMDRRLKDFEALGIDEVVIARCSHELFDLSPEAFITDVLQTHFDLKYIVEGPNFRFGHDRAGTIDWLIERSSVFGFHAIKVDPIEVDLAGRGRKMISSSLVRQLISEGAVNLAATCLSRPYELFGTVVRGAGRGKSIGYPTANLHINEQMLPADGVYACRTRIDGRSYPSAVHIGPTPTFDQQQRTVETHVLDFEGDLCGSELAVRFIKRLRSSEKFEDASALSCRLRQDVIDVRRVLTDYDG